MALNDRTVYRAALAAILVAALGLSACGRYGALEPPPGSAVATEDGKNVPPAKQPKPQRSFILDGLI